VSIVIKDDMLFKLSLNISQFSKYVLALILYHKLRGSASPVWTATGFVNGKGQFSTPHRIDAPQPITKTFVTGDYVGDLYCCANVNRLC